MEVSSAFTNIYAANRQLTRPQGQDVNAVAATEATNARDIQTQDRALTEQNDIVNSLQTNARNLQATGERVGTIIDVQV